ncbi:putative bifunctional diguanylate cyclase/phosphodiesterase [Paenibacillus sp. FSL W7-1287]|uniref:putative bifunctional diguanylate cyclase/phosphodiesterase n=1 Tax=Paenibacillus sp. FSL W7-1287 TaxID=2954538 RepID=UPI0030FBAF65
MLITTIDWEAGLDAPFDQMKMRSAIHEKLITTKWIFRDFIRHIEERQHKLVMILEIESSSLKRVEGAIRKCIGQTLTIDGRIYPIRLYIGSYYDEQHAYDERDILRSKYALQLAKKQGVKRSQVMVQEQAEQYNQEILIESLLSNGIVNRQFHLDFQPIYRLIDGELVGFEALVRWHHPQLGLLSPIQFIPLAEQNGFISELGEWIIEEACRQLVSIHERLGQSTLRVSINVSPVQFKLCNVAELALKYAQCFGLDPSYIQFELTESTMELVDEQVIEAAAALKGAGFSVAIDDFGTGYASLESVSAMPINCVKLDKHFIDKIQSNKAYLTIVKHTIRMLNEMGLELVAEGVETQEQYELLSILGCTYAQGYYMSKPIPTVQLSHATIAKLLNFKIA